MKVQLFIALLGSFGFSADMNFERQALQTISAHYGRELTDLPALDKDPEKYLRVSLGIYKNIKLNPNEAMIGQIAASQDEMYDKMSAEMLGAEFGGLSISIGGVTMTTGGTHRKGTATINGKTIITSAKTMDEVRGALQNRYDVAIRNCLSNIALAAERALINSKDEQAIILAKRFATSVSVPQDLRTILLSAFAGTNDPVLISWLLAQPDFKDSAKKDLVKSLVTKALAEKRPDIAEDLIIRHLESGLSAQQASSSEVFEYFLGLNDLENAERILKNHFTKGLSASNNLVTAMVKHLMQNNLFDNAREVANRNMDQGLRRHEEVCHAIDKAELAYLKNPKK